jgi:hypothetical protein
VEIERGVEVLGRETVGMERIQR